MFDDCSCGLTEKGVTTVILLVSPLQAERSKLQMSNTKPELNFNRGLIPISVFRSIQVQTLSFRDSLGVE
jgi:hypothetical protein